MNWYLDKVIRESERFPTPVLRATRRSVITPDSPKVAFASLIRVER